MLSCCGRVEWEMWTSSNDGCGNSCDIQTRFKKEFRDTAKQLEKVQHTDILERYLPHIFKMKASRDYGGAAHGRGWK